MTEVVIVDGVRTAIGSYGGGLSSVRPDDLLAHTYKALARRTQIDAAELDEVLPAAAIKPVKTTAMSPACPAFLPDFRKRYQASL